MKLAAIDIGSNSVRLLIAQAYPELDEVMVKKQLLTRLPIRLGEDVFSAGRILDDKQEQLLKGIKAFRLLMDVHGVESYKACATSAMRDAENGPEILEQIKKKTNIDIKVIDGKKEAQYILRFLNSLTDARADHLYVDVGGGSTEISIVKKGKLQESVSFKIGSVRMLQGKVKNSEWERMEKFLQKTSDKLGIRDAVGTGGNINRLLKMSRKDVDSLSYQRLKELSTIIDKLSYEERMSQLGLRMDRADVIAPASKIYLKVMKSAGIKKMQVPKVGLSDGMIYKLYQENFLRK